MKKGAKAGADDSGPAVPDELVRLSRALGSDPQLVLAGGGNTSVKSGDTIFVKASGLGLAGITAGGFTAVDRGALREILTRDLGGDPGRREERFKRAVMAARIDAEGLRPSVECVLHEIFPRRLVAHLHPTAVNAVTCSSSGEGIARELFGEDVLWAPYVDPGYTLA
ncbi:MAG: class II aldolase/adducin family protein, partial [Planctomycetota bacterium]